MLGINTHPPWKTVVGGSSSYLGPITAPYRERIRTGAQITGICRSGHHPKVRFMDRSPEVFDQVVFACHGDQILPLLDAPTEEELEILSGFATSSNVATLHTDEGLLPARPGARASWNYLLSSNPNSNATLTYLMNRLQSIPGPDQYCVTLNAASFIDPARVLRQVTFQHPIYNGPAIRAQQRWHEISGHNRTHICGAYWFYGFHEDGLNSALRVARALGVDA